jgi:hypothetical protein
MPPVTLTHRLTPSYSPVWCPSPPHPLLLHPTQKPLITSRVLDMVHFDELPGGQNAIIAVMSFTGYDIEDATILNKASLDRGFGRCMVTRKHVAHVKKYTNGTCDRIVGPPADAGFGVKAARCVVVCAGVVACRGCCWDGVCCPPPPFAPSPPRPLSEHARMRVPCELPPSPSRAHAHSTLPHGTCCLPCCAGMNLPFPCVPRARLRVFAQGGDCGR